MSKKFVPKVILFGDEKDLPEFSIDYEIVGHLRIETENKTARLFFNDQMIDIEDLKKISYDYVLCTDTDFYFANHYGWLGSIFETLRFVETRFFRHYVSNIGFICYSTLQSIISMLELRVPKNQAGILDFDSYLYRGNFFMDTGLKIETILDEKFEPIFYNVYDRVFKTFEEVKLRSYDAILFTAERSIDEWLEVLKWAVQSTRKIFLYVHEDSEAFEKLKTLSVNEAKIEYIPAVRGMWILIEQQRAETFQIYVTYHKPYYFPKLPKGYIKIHAGKKNSTIDLGSDFLRDDIGDNISELNRQINEYSAIYWVWKHIHSDYVGFCHYHRYFLQDKHIMTMDEAVEMLEDCDIVLRNPAVFHSTYVRNRLELPPDLQERIGYEIFLENLSKQSPEYIPIIEQMESGRFLISNTVFFSRWKVFDEYCRWVFPILIPSAQEFSKYHPFDSVRTERTMSYLAEEAFHAFIVHHNLRVKNVYIFSSGYESKEENFSADGKTLFNATI